MPGMNKCVWFLCSKLQINEYFPYFLSQMAGKLDKLCIDDLFSLLSVKIDRETATAIRDNGVCGEMLVQLSDNELKELAPKLGPRKTVKRLIDNFQRADPSQPKVECRIHALVYFPNCTIYLAIVLGKLKFLA